MKSYHWALMKDVDVAPNSEKTTTKIAVTYRKGKKGRVELEKSETEAMGNNCSRKVDLPREIISKIL